MNRMGLLFWWVALACFNSIAQVPGHDTASNKVLVFVLEQDVLEHSDVPAGDDLWAEIEYRPSPRGDVLFFEPGERIWWVREKGLLVLGGTGSPLPRSVMQRASVWIDIAIEVVFLADGPFEIFPRRDGFIVAGDQAGLKEALGKRIVGIDAPYLAQVSNYLALNNTTLEVRGDTLNIDQNGVFGTDLIVSGHHQTDEITCNSFNLTNAPSAGKVLTSDALGHGSWQDPDTGLSLPVTETFSGTGTAFSLTMTDAAGRGGIFQIDHSANANSALEARTNGTGDGLLSVHTGTAGQAGTFNSEHGSNSDACLAAKHNGPGPSLMAEKTVDEGSVAVFRSMHLTNPRPVVDATALGASWVFQGTHYGMSDGAAKFHLEEANNYSPCVEITTNGFGAGVDAKNDGWGPAGKFHNSDSMNMGHVVDISNVGEGLGLSAVSTGWGGVAKFSLDTFSPSAIALEVESNGNGDALKVKSIGPGRAGFFQIDQSANTSTALECTTNGPGTAFAASCWGDGRAANFDMMNPNTVNPAVSIYNVGGGAALDVSHQGSTGNAVWLISALTNTDATLKVTAGGGDAALFDGNVTVNGNLAVSGTVSKGGGSFRIDHPLDPENKYLYHSFVESPDMMNVYNGMVLLDERGEAWVDLPDWFEALNRDFRYQLTAIGSPAPDLHIGAEIRDLKFQIAGGVPFQKVSWQVTGVRHDPFARDHRIPTEVEKPQETRGRYLYPEGYGADSKDRIGSSETGASMAPPNP